MGRTAFWTSLILLFLSAPALAAPLPPYGAFVFSNVCHEVKSGDDAGARLIVVRLHHEDDVQYTWSEGALMPGTVDHVQIDNKTDRISFHVAPEGAPVDWGFTVNGLLSADRYPRRG